ncbi:aminotransferase class I/II-fold pyridoxal phosphate-dependent enzyme [Pseudomonas sp. AA27]|uniref:pyridoxal phosphate-dependent aminotransferase n=1 Tax=Pseudomonas sp. AA27 TaxID=2908652 RepID=UPI001F295EC7|nr:aminotransferase class I/II-fold pyridoxal phosphate-dependent enzyme [Pseudomonas sp. AA27]MCF1490355.1 aminotransferase class I/II-fold pyridoxal phosphate-dependent enzyme [Pseudomonas sp. AA27]
MPTLSADLEFARFCPILGVAQKVREAPQPVIDLGVGVPGFLPAPHIVEAAVRAAHEDTGGYGASRGDPALLKAYLGYLRRLGHMHFDERNLVAGLGAKHLLFSVLRAIIRPGDKLLVSTPCWPTYFDIADLVGAGVVDVRCTAQSGYKMSPQALEQALDEQVRVVLLNSPGNPTGAVYSVEELQGLAQVLRKHDVWIICDDVYQRFVYDMDRCPDLLTVAPDLAGRIIKIDSVSKLYGMPGWRVGLLAADRRIADAVTTLNSNSISNLPAPAAAAATAALDGDQAFSIAARQRLAGQRQALLEVLRGTPLLRFCEPAGAFYLFLDIGQALGRSFRGQVISDDESFCDVLLRDFGVALIPGSFFGAAGHARLSYSGEAGKVLAGAERIKAFLGELA